MDILVCLCFLLITLLLLGDKTGKFHTCFYKQETFRIKLKIRRILLIEGRVCVFLMRNHKYLTRSICYMKKLLYIIVGFIIMGYLFLPFNQTLVIAKDRSVNALNKQLPKEFQNAIQKARAPFFADIEKEKVKQFKKYLTPNLDSKEDKKIARELKSFGNKEETEQKNKRISLEKAKQDINFCFSYLKYGYAGYQFFGGDRKFIEAKKEIKKEISNQQKNKITTEKLEEIFVKYTKDFLHDGHFSVGNTNMYKFLDSIYYSNDTILFKKEENKNEYTTTIDKKVYHLLEVNGKSPEKYLHMTLDSNGYLAYAIGMSSTSEEFSKEKKVILTLKKIQNLSIVEKEIILTVNYRSYLPFPAYNRLEKNGVLLIENRSMMAENKKEKKQLNAFMEDAKSLKKYNTLILDLRGNGGGSDTYPSTWMKNYASLSYFPENNVIASTLNTYTSNQSINLEKDRESNFAYGWSKIEYQKSINKIKNNHLIFVLIDSGTVSSGESFVAYLTQMENVIFVGNSTAGMYTIANNRTIILPNSGLHIYCGSSLFLPPDLKSIEGKGFSPDLWITPQAGEGDIFEDTCVDRIIKFIENYHLN